MDIFYYRRVISFLFDWQNKGLLHTAFALCVCSFFIKIGLPYVLLFIFLISVLFYFVYPLLSHQNQKFYFLLLFLLLVFSLFMQQAVRQAKHAEQNDGRIQNMTLHKRETLSFGEKKNLLLCQNRKGENYAVWFEAKQELPNKISGTFLIEKPEKQRNPGGFDQQKYLASFNCYALAKPVEVSSQFDFRGNLNFLKRQELEKFHFWLSEHIQSNNADFILSFCFGQKFYLNHPLKQSFANLGLGHVLAISGFHFELFLLPFFKLFPAKKKKSLLVYTGIAVSVLLFLWLTDFPIGLIRASLTYFLDQFFVAKHIFVPKKQILYMILIGLLLLNPFLAWQSAFQLSFLISYLIYSLTPYLLKINLLRKYRILHTLSLHYFLQLLMVPLLVQNMRIAVLSAFLMNLLLAFPLAVCFLNGYILFLVYLFHEWLNIPLLKSFTSYFYTSVLRFLEILGQSDMQSFLIRNQKSILIRMIVLFLMYVFIYTFFSKIKYFVLRPHINWRMKKTASIYLLAILLLWQIFTRNPSWSITFLDVGQGDSCLIISPRQKTLMIDGGKRDKGYEVIIPAMQEHGIKKIDYALISHLDMDHCGGIIDLLEMNLIKELIVPMKTFAPQKGEYHLQKEILEQCLKYQIPILELQAGDRLELPLLQLQTEIISPREAYYSARKMNQMSLCFRLTIEDLSLLFTGDMDLQIEKDLLAEQLFLQSDILKIAHHGSRYSTSMAFLEQVNPQLAIISVGYNFYGHPHPDLLNRLAEKQIENKRTDKNGAIMLKLINNSWEVSTFIE